MRRSREESPERRANVQRRRTEMVGRRFLTHNPNVLPPRRDVEDLQAIGIDVEGDYASFRPIRRANDSLNFPLIVMGAYAVEMRRFVLRQARAIAPTLNNRQIKERVKMSVFMYNWDNHPNTNAMKNISFEDLTGSTLLKLFEEALAANSQPDLDMYDIVWKLWLNRNSLTTGASNKTKAEQVGLFVMNEYKEIGCASKALAIGVVKKENIFAGKGLRTYKPFHRFLTDMENKLKFIDPKNVAITEFEKFVELYPTYRVVILTATTTKPTIFCGKSYARDLDSKKDSTIYIYLDMVKHHYTLVTSPVQYYRALKKCGDIKWCHNCCSWLHGSNNSSCLCGEIVTVTRKLKEKKCEHCNEIYKGKHSCGQSSCHHCTLLYKNGQVCDHRCPLMVKNSRVCRVFKGDENEYLHEQVANMKRQRDQKQHELWVWDIESHFVMTEDKTFKFIVNDDGTFETNENNEVIVMEVNKLAQLGNYIYCKNVFTGEERDFESMVDFINFTQTNNDGFNYFLAHNSSGYDSRLLFEEACKVLKEPPQPLMKGLM